MGSAAGDDKGDAPAAEEDLTGSLEEENAGALAAHARVAAAAWVLRWLQGALVPRTSPGVLGWERDVPLDQDRTPRLVHGGPYAKGARDRYRLEVTLEDLVSGGVATAVRKIEVGEENPLRR